MVYGPPLQYELRPGDESVDRLQMPPPFLLATRLRSACALGTSFRRRCPPLNCKRSPGIKMGSPFNVGSLIRWSAYSANSSPTGVGTLCQGKRNCIALTTLSGSRSAIEGEAAASAPRYRVGQDRTDGRLELYSSVHDNIDGGSHFSQSK